MMGAVENISIHNRRYENKDQGREEMMKGAAVSPGGT